MLALGLARRLRRGGEPERAHPRRRRAATDVGVAYGRSARGVRGITASASFLRDRPGLAWPGLAGNVRTPDAPCASRRPPVDFEGVARPSGGLRGAARGGLRRRAEPACESHEEQRGARRGPRPRRRDRRGRRRPRSAAAADQRGVRQHGPRSARRQQPSRRRVCAGRGRPWVREQHGLARDPGARRAVYGCRGVPRRAGGSSARQARSLSHARDARSVRAQLHRRLRAPRLPGPARRGRARRPVRGLRRERKAIELHAGNPARPRGDAAVTEVPLSAGAGRRSLEDAGADRVRDCHSTVVFHLGLDPRSTAPRRRGGREVDGSWRRRGRGAPAPPGSARRRRHPELSPAVARSARARHEVEDPTIYPAFTPELERAIVEETLRFSAYAVLHQGLCGAVVPWAAPAGPPREQPLSRVRSPLSRRAGPRRRRQRRCRREPRRSTAGARGRLHGSRGPPRAIAAVGSHQDGSAHRGGPRHRAQLDDGGRRRLGEHLPQTRSGPADRRLEQQQSPRDSQASDGAEGTGADSR